MKLYIWECTGGRILAIAHDLDEAKAVVFRKWKDMDEDDFKDADGFEEAPQVIDLGPVALWAGN